MRVKGLLLLVVALAACGGSPDGATATTSSGETTTSSSSTTTVADTTTTTTSATTSTSATAGPGEGADCLVGTWELDSEAFVASFQDVYGGTEISDSRYVEGQLLATFEPDGTFRDERQDWTWEMETAGGVFRMRVNGENHGSYAVDGERLSVTMEEIGVDVSMEMEMNGEGIELPGSGDLPVEPPVVEGSGTFTCSGDRFSLVSDEGVESHFTRVG